jgi:phage tail-like protein
MSITGNILKSYDWILELDGLPKFSIQKVTLPEIEIEEVMHSMGVYDEKTPGRIKTTDLVCEKIMPFEDIEDWAWKMLNDAQSYALGGKLPGNFRTSARLVLTQPDAVTFVKQYVMENIWVKKIATSDLDKSSSENIIETVTFSVSRFRKVIA